MSVPQRQLAATPLTIQGQAKALLSGLHEELRSKPNIIHGKEYRINDLHGIIPRLDHRLHSLLCITLAWCKLIPGNDAVVTCVLGKQQ